jgi:hypothetical protein
MQITEYELKHYLGATGEELLKLRILLDQDIDGHYERAEAARILLAIRKGTAGRDQITESYRRQQSEQRRFAPAGLVGKLRRASHRRVPPTPK